MTASELAAVPDLFNWQKPVVVSRAPGRLDVLGGIAYCSGSMVLQVRIQRTGSPVVLRADRELERQCWVPIEDCQLQRVVHQFLN